MDQMNNIGAFHPKIRLNVALASQPFIAGQEVCGKIDLECKTDKGLAMSTIMVELFAMEELTSRDHSALSNFIHSRRLFQGPSLPPSNAVYPQPPPGMLPLPTDYYTARKGESTFFFQLPLPPTSPASIKFGGGLAKIRYQVKASVSILWKGEKQTLSESKEVDIVQCPQTDDAECEPVIGVAEGGKIWAKGSIVGGHLVAGRQATCELHIRNNSTKKSTGVTISLTRHLCLNSSVTQKNPMQVSDTLVTVPFKGPEYTVAPGSEGIAHLSFEVPKLARGVRAGDRHGAEDEANRISESLFHVKCSISVKIGMGIGVKDLVIDIPVTIYHPLALPPSPPQSPPNAYASNGQYGTPYGVEPFSLEPPHPHFAQHMNHITPPGSPYYSQTPGPHTPETHPAYFHTPSPHPSSPVYYNLAGSPPPMISPYPPSSPQPYPLSSPHPQYVSFSPPPQHYDPFAYSLPPPMDTHQHYDPSAYVHVPPYGYSYAHPGPYPARPSSADPHIAQPPPISLADITHYTGNSHRSADGGASFPPRGGPTVAHDMTGGSEAQEGKGERASRISRHLRHATRHRSVSPVSHRFPVLTMAPAGANVATLTAPAPFPAPASSHRDISPTSLNLNLNLSLSPGRQRRTSPGSPSARNQGGGNVSPSVSLPRTPALKPTHHQHSPSLLSPRPLHSPSHSFPFDQESGGSQTRGNSWGSGRSKRVEELERMVADAAREEKEDEGGVVGERERAQEEEREEREERERERERGRRGRGRGRGFVPPMDIDKTLPGPPVPTGKPRAAGVRSTSNGTPTAADVFGLGVSTAGAAENPPKPAVIQSAAAATNKSQEVVTAFRALRNEGAAASSARGVRPSASDPAGLDALEKWLLARSKSAAGREGGAGSRKLTASVSSGAVVDSSPQTQKDTLARPEPVPAAVKTREPSPVQGRALSVSTPMEKAADQPISPARATAGEPRPNTQPEAGVDRSGPIVVNREALRLRKEAKGRVHDWLQGVDPSEKPPRSDSPEKDRNQIFPTRPESPVKLESYFDTPPLAALTNVEPKQTSPRLLSSKRLSPSAVIDVRGDYLSSSPMDIRLAEVKPVVRDSRPQSPRAAPLQSVAEEAHDEPPPRGVKTAPIVAVSASPAEVHGMGLPTRAEKLLQSNYPQMQGPGQNATSPGPSPSPHTPPKPIRNLRLPAFPPSPALAVDGPKYDIRSARGGRGGVVTNVAALWASILPGETEAKSTPPKTPRTPAQPSPSPTPRTRYQQSPQSPQSPLDSRQNRAVKSSADPAAINGTMARPYISSTASLARPLRPAGAPIPLKPHTPPSAKRTTMISPHEQQGVGQARLKDLISKYQNAAG